MTKSRKELQEYSQHKSINHAFYNFDTGGWKCGIWGMRPSEILHQLLKVLPYAEIGASFEQ